MQVPGLSDRRLQHEPRKDKTSEILARSMLRGIRIAKKRTGDQLPTEAQMMEEYGVGRGTMREALRILEVNGLISIKPGPGGGPTVGGASPENFGRMATLFFQRAGFTYRELIEARLILEPVAARLAAERKSILKGTGGQLASIAGVDDVKDDSTYLQRSSDFHEAVVHASGNGIVALFSDSLAHVFREKVSGVVFPERRRKDIVRTHVMIADAIGAGDGPRAEQLMREHMNEYAKYVGQRYPAMLDEVVEWR
jgi:GntR family transcriptional regulator, transcriptional repressor for pyruvate dehydrogenase complex